MVLCMINIVLTVLLHKEVSKEKTSLQGLVFRLLINLVEESRARDSMIMQVLLLGQHKQGLHEGEAL